MKRQLMILWIKRFLVLLLHASRNTSQITCPATSTVSWRLPKIAGIASDKLKAVYGEAAMIESVVFELYKKFKEEWEDIWKRYKRLDLLDGNNPSIIAEDLDRRLRNWSFSARCSYHWLIFSFCLKKNDHKVRHPPYRPDLAHCYFWLCPKIKSSIKGCRYPGVSDIQRHMARILKSIPEMFWSLIRYTAAQGKYFEKDDSYKFVNI